MGRGLARQHRAGMQTLILMHLLPGLLVAVIVAAAWKYPVVGATGFALAALAYAMMTRRLDWFLVIGMPLLLISALYAVNARRGSRA